MQMRLFRRETWSVWMVACALSAILAGAAAAGDDVPDVDPAGVTDPVERKFYQDLRELREKQRHNREELGKEDISPDERIEKRRAMLLHDHQALQELEASYQSKLTPEEVRYVRAVFVPRSKEFSATALAKQFGTSVAAMCKIVTRQTYQDIE